MKLPSEGILELVGNEIEFADNSPLCAYGQSKKDTLAEPIPESANIGVIVGMLSGFSESGLPLVDFPENKSGAAVVARSTVALSLTQIGCEVVLAFDRGDSTKPIILGFLLTGVCIERDVTLNAGSQEERLLLSAQKEVVLECGEAKITLTRAGKVLIRGEYIVTQSSGVNRIRGGSVQIN